jgi:hypothetical protein
MAGSVEGSEFVGAKAQALRGLLSVRYPIGSPLILSDNYSAAYLITM